MAALLPYTTWGNDGVFYVNGNHLVPIQETDIALAKEVLSIRLGDDGYAEVDVQYELMNNGPAKGNSFRKENDVYLTWYSFIHI